MESNIDGPGLAQFMGIKGIRRRLPPPSSPHPPIWSRSYMGLGRLLDPFSLAPAVDDLPETPTITVSRQSEGRKEPGHLWWEGRVPRTGYCTVNNETGHLPRQVGMALNCLRIVARDEELDERNITTTAPTTDQKNAHPFRPTWTLVHWPAIIKDQDRSMEEREWNNALH